MPVVSYSNVVLSVIGGTMAPLAGSIFELWTALVSGRRLMVSFVLSLPHCANHTASRDRLPCQAESFAR